MRNIYFDLCAIPLYGIILWTCISRRLTRGRVNRIFLWMNGLSLACTVLDIAMEFTVNPVPLSGAAVTGGILISFLYLLLRNGTLVIYFCLLFPMTRTDYRLRSRASRWIILLPYAAVVILLLQNFFTMNVFSVTREEGYSREGLMTAVYGAAALYGVTGFVYCLSCRRFLSFNKWFSILSVYLLTFIAVVVQLVWPDLLVEMFSTGIGLLMILMHVMRPEETMEPALGVHSWKAYQDDLANLLRTKQHAQIIAAQLMNASELRIYLGDEGYDRLLQRGLETFRRWVPHPLTARSDIYFERPGTMYVILENMDQSPDWIYRKLEEAMEKNDSLVPRESIRMELKVCLINAPEDLSQVRDILNLGHRFPLLGPEDQQLFRAAELVNEHSFEVINHTEEILNRAVLGDSLEVFYQPIYDLRRKSFRSAEALARLRDREYGLVSPSIFIPAAERSGLIIFLGEKIMEAVFRFLSKHDLRGLGLDYIEINLSVAQCMDRRLLDTVRRLQHQYSVPPSSIRFEITETTYNQISDSARESLNALSAMGYGFALDDYGVGFTNVQRLSRMNFDIIKVDKSIVDDLFTVNGRLVMQNTVRMMHDLNKQIVMEGVETKETLQALAEMSGDFIQGFYYSRPLPEAEFLRFLEARRAAGAEDARD